MTDRITSFQTGPATTFVLEGDVAETVASWGSHGRWRIRFALRAENGPGGTTGSQFLGSGSQTGYLFGPFGQVAATPFLPPGYANGAQRWRYVYDVWVEANSNGYWSGTQTSITAIMGLLYGSVNTSPTGVIPLPRIERPPGAPGQPSVTDITPTGAKFSWTAAARGNANITDYGVYISTSPTFSSLLYQEWEGVVLTKTLTAELTPGTTYYVRIRARNADGNGVYSAARPFTTLPATSPGLTVNPTLNGQGASVSVSPPGGATGITKYTVEYRQTGTTTPVTAVENASSPVVVASGLTPGATYDWRASAWFGTYQSPWTDWTPVAQPNPNTNPGDYFDGSTPARPDLTFTWSGTAGNSTSIATGEEVLGWDVFTTGGLSAVMYRVTGGIVGNFSARVSVLVGSTTPTNLSFGQRDDEWQYRSVVQPLADYFVSTHVIPSRATRLALLVTYYDGDGDEIDSETVGEQEVAAGETTRLVGKVVPPSAADTITVRVTGAAGTGWSNWVAGDAIVMDAMAVTLGIFYPYFDGFTPDTPYYDYQWIGLPSQSRSRRVSLNPLAVDPLADPDCPPLPPPPAFPAIPAECIEEVGQWRSYMVEIPPSEVRNWKTTIPTVRLTTLAQSERQVRVRFYANPDEEDPGLVVEGDWESEQILSYLPANTTVVLDGLTERVRASVNGGEYVPANHLLYGTGGVPASWPRLICGYGYVMTLDVPLESPPGNLQSHLFMTQAM